MSDSKRNTSALQSCYTNSESQVEIEEEFIAELRLGGKETHLEPSQKRCCEPCPFLVENYPLFLAEKIFPSVPRNARSKRALDARAPKEIEGERTAIFVRGSHTGEVLNSVMKDLVCCSFPPCVFSLVYYVSTRSSKSDTTLADGVEASTCYLFLEEE